MGLQKITYHFRLSGPTLDDIRDALAAQRKQYVRLEGEECPFIPVPDEIAQRLPADLIPVEYEYGWAGGIRDVLSTEIVELFLTRDDRLCEVSVRFEGSWTSSCGPLSRAIINALESFGPIPTDPAPSGAERRSGS